MFYEALAATALAFGTLIGLGSLVSPNWAAGVVRLVEDPDKAGGFAEFRATYGGLLMMLHLTGLIALFMLPPVMGLAAVLPIAAGWAGAGFGRMFSLIFDAKRLREPAMNPIWIAVELILAIAIAAPAFQIAGTA
jgi:hypothetical protein